MMNKSEKSRSAGMGVGYVSVMLIFAVICLTIFAVLSFKAALSNKTLNERSGEFLKQYYLADTAAKETLAEINDRAGEVKGSPFFEEEFIDALGEIDGVSAESKNGGVAVSFTSPINERQEIAAELLFPSDGNYTVNKWQSCTMGDWDNTNSDIHVWDGTF